MGQVELYFSYFKHVFTTAISLKKEIIYYRHREEKNKKIINSSKLKSMLIKHHYFFLTELSLSPEINVFFRLLKAINENSAQTQKEDI